MTKILMNAAKYFCLAVMVLMLTAACSGTDEIGEVPSNAVCGSIVNAKCVKCHYKTRICNAVGTKSVHYWKKTINFMLKQGAELSRDEQDKVIACLSTLPEGSEVVCD